MVRNDAMMVRKDGEGKMVRKDGEERWEKGHRNSGMHVNLFISGSTQTASSKSYSTRL